MGGGLLIQVLQIRPWNDRVHRLLLLYKIGREEPKATRDGDTLAGRELLVKPRFPCQATTVLHFGKLETQFGGKGLGDVGTPGEGRYHMCGVSYAYPTLRCDLRG